MSTNDAIEQEIVDKGLTSPRVTPADIESVIVSEKYFTAADGVFGATGTNIVDSKDPLNLITFCVLVLTNGFTVHGVSAVASPENFNKEIGQKIARQDAMNKIWPLLGYELKSRLAEPRNIFYVDAGDLGSEEIAEYIDKVKRTLKFATQNAGN